MLCNGQRIRNRDRDSILFPNAADEFRLTDSYKLQTSTHTIPSRFSSDNDFSNNNNFLTEFSWNVFKVSVKTFIHFPSQNYDNCLIILNYDKK